MRWARRRRRSPTCRTRLPFVPSTPARIEPTPPRAWGWWEGLPPAGVALRRRSICRRFARRDRRRCLHGRHRRRGRHPRRRRHPSPHRRTTAAAFRRVLSVAWWSAACSSSSASSSCARIGAAREDVLKSQPPRPARRRMRQRRPRAARRRSPFAAARAISRPTSRRRPSCGRTRRSSARRHCSRRCAPKWRQRKSPRTLRPTTPRPPSLPPCRSPRRRPRRTLCGPISMPRWARRQGGEGHGRARSFRRQWRRRPSLRWRATARQRRTASPVPPHPQTTVIARWTRAHLAAVLQRRTAAVPAVAAARAADAVRPVVGARAWAAAQEMVRKGRRSSTPFSI